MEPSDAPPPYSPSEEPIQHINNNDHSIRQRTLNLSPLPPLPPSPLLSSPLPSSPPQPSSTIREKARPRFSSNYHTMSSSSNSFIRHSDTDRNTSPTISNVDMEGNVFRSSVSPSMHRYNQYSNSAGESSSSSSGNSPTSYEPATRSSTRPNRSNSLASSVNAHSILNREGTSTSNDLEYCHNESKVKEFNKSNSKLLIKQSNSPLELKLSWSGADCQLKNSNGDIIIHGSLNANKSIQLESDKGDITIAGRMLATKDIFVKATNGSFDSRGESIIARAVHIEHSNRPITLTNIIEAKKICIKTTNSPIKCSNISVGSQLQIKTTNAAIEVFINDTGSNSVKMDIETTNAPINVYVPNKYSGTFNVRSSNGLVTVVSKFADVSKSVVTFKTDQDSKKTGFCKNSWNKSKCSVNIKTTNAPATLYIQ